MTRDQQGHRNPWGARFPTPTNHAFPTRSTTTIGVVGAVTVSTLGCVTSSPMLFPPQGKLFSPCTALHFSFPVFFQVAFLYLLIFFLSSFNILYSFSSSIELCSLFVSYPQTTGPSGPLLCDRNVGSATTTALCSSSFPLYCLPVPSLRGTLLLIWQSNEENAPLLLFWCYSLSIFLHLFSTPKAFPL